MEREDDGFVALCPELDIASQGSSIEEARANLIEALTLFFETASEGAAASVNVRDARPRGQDVIAGLCQNRTWLTSLGELSLWTYV